MQRYGGFGDSQIFWPDLLRVVATEWDGCDIGGLRAKILSHEQRKWGLLMWQFLNLLNIYLGLLKSVGYLLSLQSFGTLKKIKERKE